MGLSCIEARGVYLKPGELYASEAPAVVTTVLGSCIAAVFFNSGARLGAMCHALLPTGADAGDGFRYVDFCMYWMLEWFGARGFAPGLIEVKLFGGSSLLGTPKAGRREVEGVGEQNIRRAMEIIEKERLNLVSYDLGGKVGRRIVFDTASGRVQLLRHKGKLRG
jgi:chemotaxis protein CheD